MRLCHDITWFNFSANQLLIKLVKYPDLSSPRNPYFNSYGEVKVEASSKLNIESVSRLEANSIPQPRKSIS